MEISAKKLALAGLGLAVVGKKKIKEIFKNIEEQAGNSEKEMKLFFNELLKEGENAKKELDKNIKEKIDLYLNKVDLARKKEIDNLKNKVKELEEEISILASKIKN